jgi:hypothetical protein
VASRRGRTTSAAGSGGAISLRGGDRRVEQGLELGIVLAQADELPKTRPQAPSTNPFLIARSWSLKIAIAVFMRLKPSFS